jgi:Ca2+-binding RTX toxin-like protein
VAIIGDSKTSAAATLRVNTDTTPPTCVKAESSMTLSNIVVTFSEAIARGAGAIVIHQGSATGPVVESFDVATSARLGLGGAVLTIDPVATLSEGAQYFVTFGAGTLLDIAGNGYAGTSAYDFTTVAPVPLNLTGTAGADKLTGGALDDTLNGLGGTDVLDGRGGSDLYLIASAADHAAAEIADTGTSGTDEVRFTATSSGTLTLYAGDTGIERVVIGAATIAAAAGGGGGTAALNVNAAAVLNGLTLVGDAGANSLTGTAFDDVLVGGAGNDTLAGGAGSDTASYFSSTAGVKVNLGLAKAQDTLGAGKDTLTSIENLIGGSGDDTLTGSAAANRIEGGAGNDSLLGLGGADSLLGGNGNDSLKGGAGADALWGGIGADTFVLSALSDSLAASSDIIWDFNPVEGDKIDLSAIDAITGGKDQAFTLVNAFSQTAGELTVTSASGHYLVEGDVTGDGIADFSMTVYSTDPITTANFIV